MIQYLVLASVCSVLIAAVVLLIFLAGALYELLTGLIK